jgi:hypothetical protein
MLTPVLNSAVRSKIKSFDVDDRCEYHIACLSPRVTVYFSVSTLYDEVLFNGCA